MVETKFKHTDIGLIPEDWEVKTIMDVADISGGGTPSTRNSIFWNGSINWFTPTEVGKTKYLFNSLRKITEIGLNNCSARILPAGTILMTTRAGIGDLGILKFPSATNQGFQSLIPLENADGEFLFYLASTLKPVLLQNASGSTFLEISPSKVKSIQIPLPPLPEQQAIAEVLSDTDNWIESLEKLIAKKQLIKQGAMQQLLTPREGWKINRLGNFVVFQTGFPFSSEYFNTKNKGLRLVKNRDLRSDDSIVYYSGDYPKDYLVNKGELLIGMDGDFEPILWKKDIALLNQRVGRVVPKKQISIPFLSFILVKKLKEIESSTGSTTVKHLSHSDVEQIELELPKYEEQIRIATILSDMDTEIEALEQKLAKAKQIKQGLMQELLTGRIRLA